MKNIVIGDNVNFFTKHSHLWRGMGPCPFPAVVDKINEDGSLNLNVSPRADHTRYVQNVLPIDQGEDHFWYEVAGHIEA